MQKTTIVNVKANSFDGKSLHGQIRIEDRSTEYYYCWGMYEESGLRLAGRCLPVSKRIIPDNVEPLDFVLNHAIQGINMYRILRKKVYNVVEWQIQENSDTKK